MAEFYLEPGEEEVGEKEETLKTLCISYKPEENTHLNRKKEGTDNTYKRDSPDKTTSTVDQGFKVDQLVTSTNNTDPAKTPKKDLTAAKSVFKGNHTGIQYRRNTNGAASTNSDTLQTIRPKTKNKNAVPRKVKSETVKSQRPNLPHSHTFPSRQISEPEVDGDIGSVRVMSTIADNIASHQQEISQRPKLNHQTSFHGIQVKKLTMSPSQPELQSPTFQPELQVHDPCFMVPQCQMTPYTTDLKTKTSQDSPQSMKAPFTTSQHPMPRAELGQTSNVRQSEGTHENPPVTPTLCLMQDTKQHDSTNTEIMPDLTPSLETDRLASMGSEVSLSSTASSTAAASSIATSSIATASSIATSSIAIASSIETPSSIGLTRRDFLLLYSEDDQADAATFREHLIQDIGVHNLTVDMFSDIDCGKSAFQDLDTLHDRYHNVLTYITKNFKKDGFTRLLNESVLTFGLLNGNGTEGRIIPIWTSKASKRFVTEMICLKGFEYYHFSSSDTLKDCYKTKVKKAVIDGRKRQYPLPGEIPS